MNFENRPTWRGFFTLFLFAVPTGYAIFYAIISYRYFLNKEYHVLFAVTQYSKAALAFIIAGYSIMVGYLIIKKHKNFALHAKFFLIILLISPVILEVPYFLIDIFLGIPFPTPMEIKAMLSKLPFTVPISIIFLAQLKNMKENDTIT